MPNDKGNVRLNEVFDRRSAEGGTEMKAKLNSASFDRMCRFCDGRGSFADIDINGRRDVNCGFCGGTGREAPQGAERRSNVQIEGQPASGLSRSNAGLDTCTTEKHHGME